MRRHVRRLRRDHRIRVAHRGEIRGPGSRVEILEQAVVARFLAQLRHPALGVVQVAERDRLRRAGALAGRADVAVPDATIFELGGDAGGRDALRAVRALLHHATAAHRDLGVARHLERLGVPVGVEQEVEPPHLVRAVVRAVARAHAAVVDHVVQPLLVVDRRRDGTHHFARCVLALHAGDGLVVHRGVVEVALVVAVDADPVHLAPRGDLLLAHDRDVVLRHARHDAGIAAVAGVEVDDHPPLVAFVRPLVAMQRVLVLRDMRHVLGERRLGLVERERRPCGRSHAAPC